jgi:hypothetical protein
MAIIWTNPPTLADIQADAAREMRAREACIRSEFVRNRPPGPPPKTPEQQLAEAKRARELAPDQWVLDRIAANQRRAQQAQLPEARPTGWGAPPRDGWATRPGASMASMDAHVRQERATTKAKRP